MSVLTGIQKVVYPNDASSQKDFDEAIQIDEPIQICWPKVKGSAFHLCVGTAPGKWDILSGDVGKRRQQLFDLSDVPASVPVIYVQLITIAEEGSTVGEPIAIKTILERSLKSKR